MLAVGRWTLFGYFYFACTNVRNYCTDQGHGLITIKSFKISYFLITCIFSIIIYIV